MSTAVIVFARAPRPGEAKTRLTPALGAVGAAALAERMLVHAVAQAAGAGAQAVELCVTPDDAVTDALFMALQRMHPALALSTQGGGDLGERMARALGRALQAHDAALLMGTDAPGLDAATIARAAAALGPGPACDAVFVPALDGGYVLVGLARPAPALFAGVAWSTDRVMQQTRERAAAAGLRLVELAPVADIDEPADLRHLPPGWRQAIEPSAPR